MNGSDSLPGLLSQLAGEGKCSQVKFVNWKTSAIILLLPFLLFPKLIISPDISVHVHMFCEMAK